MAKKGPCWEGYEMIGMKSKGERKVPNCVKKANVGLHAEKPKKKQKAVSGDKDKRRKELIDIQNPISDYDKKGKLKYTAAYQGKFIKHDSGGIDLSNKNLSEYYGDLLK